MMHLEADLLTIKKLVFQKYGHSIQHELIRISEPETTKQCPVCGNQNLIQVRTLNYKHCADCNTELNWSLSPGQVLLA